MNSAELEKAGKLLFGEQWQSNLAQKLNIDSRRIRHWMAGTRPIPFFVGDEVAKLLEENQIQIKDFLTSFDNEQAEITNNEYYMLVNKLFNKLKLTSESDDLLTKNTVACLPTQRLVDKYFDNEKKGKPAPDFICFLKNGIWHADLLTKYNRQKDETIFYEALLYTDGTFRYDLVAHEFEKAKHLEKLKNKEVWEIL